ncbi:MAG: hypothetical protein WBA22_19805 [Candidatus Methanofastidiosia archaeon]
MKKKHTPLQCIRVVQYNLFDFMEGIPKPVDTVIRERLSRNTRRMHLPQVALLDRDHFGSVNPVCPHCGSAKFVKNGEVSSMAKKTIKVADIVDIKRVIPELIAHGYGHYHTRSLPRRSHPLPGGSIPLLFLSFFLSLFFVYM